MAGAFLTDDLTSVFNANDFGENAGVVTWKGAAINHVIFDDADVETLDEDNGVILEHQAMLTGRTSDFAGIARGDAVVARSVSYTVRYWKDDGTGVIEIFLQKV